jgi:hypothetical protein
VSPAQRERLAALRAAPGPVQVVGYSDQELQERALAEALAAARALGRLWRRRASRTARLALLESLGAPLPLERPVVDALIKATLTGGFRLVPRQGMFYEQALRLVDDHEPFELSRPPLRLRPGGA